jgi:hypothetical protein
MRSDMRITCESFLHQVVPFLEGELSDSQKDIMTHHLETCIKCSEIAANLDQIQLDRDLDLIGKKTSQQELHVDFWKNMDAVLKEELDNNFESSEDFSFESIDPSNQTNPNKSLHLISEIDTDGSIKKQNPPQNLTIISPVPPSTSVVHTSKYSQEIIQSRRKNYIEQSPIQFREMILAALCLCFVIWGYHQQQQNIILQQQIQLQDSEIRQLQISIEKRPSSPRDFQEPYVMPAKYVPNRLDL